MRSKERIIYSIVISNWAKYNSKMKKGHKATLISNNFCDDSKLRVLPLSVRWMYLACLLTAGDQTSDCIEMTESQLRAVLESSWSVPRALDALKQLQLLTYAKNEILLNRIEKKRIEENRIPKGQHELKVVEKEPIKKQAKPKPPAAISPEKINVVIAKYCELWKNRYKANPLISGRSAGQMRTFTKDFGADKCCELIEAFLRMPDQWFVKRRHDIPTLMNNLNAITQFLETGRMISQKEINQLDQAVAGQNLANDILERGI